MVNDLFNFREMLVGGSIISGGAVFRETATPNLVSGGEGQADD
jgi:hypothetical protein